MNKKVGLAVDFMERVANNSQHGYSQIKRWGNPDYDCSSLVITAFLKAGFNLNGATYTGNMKEVFLKAGFKDIKSEVNLKFGVGLKRGDILLNERFHTAVYCGNGKMVHARADEKGGIVGNIPGDQTGGEIAITPYYLYGKGWDCVLRYEEVDSGSGIIDDKEGEIKKMSDKEKNYAIEAIKRLAALGKLNNPERHIKDVDKSNWAQWVVLAKLAEEE